MGEIRRRVRVATSAAVISIVGVSCVTACGSSGDQASVLERPHSTASASQGPADDNHTKPPVISDPTAAPYHPVRRAGSPAHTRLGAHPEPFSKPVTYSDHISVKVLRVAHSTTTDMGPGEIPGRPVTTLTIRFTNGSQRPVNLDQVVLTTTYGSEPLVAQPVYDDVERDFGSRVVPGHSAVATYSFSIPSDDLDQVTVRVDFDGLHAAATFAGSVR